MTTPSEPGVTCTLDYRIDPDRIDQFEAYARAWIALVPRFGGRHHGYFLPHEGANDRAWAMFSFPSLAAYEAYRKASEADEDCCRAYAFARENGLIRSYERSFTRPVLDGSLDGLRGAV